MPAQALDAGSVVVALHAETAQFTRAFNESERTLGAFSSKATKVGKAMTLAITAPAIAIGALALREFARLETAMNNVNVIARQSTKDLNATTEAVSDLAVELGKQPVDLANALFNINSAGFQAASGLEVLEVATQAAVGGLISTELAAKGITSALNAYGLAASDAAMIADILFKTNELGVTTFGELAAGMGKVVPTANALSVDFGQVGAAMATMTRGGIETSEAYTSLNALLLKVLNPTDALKEVFAATADATGSATIANQGLIGTLEIIKTAALSAGEGIKPLEDGLGKLGPTENALKATLSLLRGETSEFKGDLAAIATEAGRAGAAQDAFEQNSKGLTRQLAKLKALVSVTAGEIGKVLAPAFIDMVTGVRAAVTWFRKLDVGTKKIIIGVTAAAAAVGPLLIGIGALGAAIPAIVAGAGAIATAFAFLLPLTPLLIAAAAAGLAIGGIVALVGNRRKKKKDAEGSQFGPISAAERVLAGKGFDQFQADFDRREALKVKFELQNLDTFQAEQNMTPEMREAAAGFDAFQKEFDEDTRTPQP